MSCMMNQPSLSSLEEKRGRDNIVHLTWLPLQPPGRPSSCPALEMIESMLGLNGVDLPRSMGFCANIFPSEGCFPTKSPISACLPFFRCFWLWSGFALMGWSR